MHLFLLTQGARPASAATLRRAVTDAGGAFSQLDPATLWDFTSASGMTAGAGMHHPAEVAAPRRYHARAGDKVALFDGLPLALAGAYPAHDADALLPRWEQVCGVLEGQFCAVRADLARDAVDCLTDPLGIRQVFATRWGKGYVLSNSVEAIRRLTGAATPDGLGVGSFLSIGACAGSSTLIDGISVLPGGHRYRVSAGRLTATSYMSPATLAPRRMAVRRRPVAEVTDSLVGLSAAAAGVGVPLRCALTAGRDPRVALVLLRASGAAPECYPIGEPDDLDVVVARSLATALGLPYEVWPAHEDSLPSDWAGLARTSVAQTDGLSSLAQVADYVDQLQPVSELGIKAWGAGGEIGRGGSSSLTPLTLGAPPGSLSYALQGRVIGSKARFGAGLWRPEAVAATRRYLHEFVASRRLEGWRPREMPEAFYAFERIARWAATGPRRTAGTDDVFSPFCTRTFVEYCFSLSSRERYAEAPHYRILSALDPVIRDLPYEVPWRPQSAALALPHAASALAASVAGRLPRRHRSGSGRALVSASPRFAWLERHLAGHRDLCLSAEGSPLWDWIDRNRLAAAFDAPTRDAETSDALLRAITLFWYFHGQADS